MLLISFQYSFEEWHFIETIENIKETFTFFRIYFCIKFSFKKVNKIGKKKQNLLQICLNFLYFICLFYIFQDNSFQEYLYSFYHVLQVHIFLKLSIKRKALNWKTKKKGVKFVSFIFTFCIVDLIFFILYNQQMTIWKKQQKTLREPKRKSFQDFSLYIYNYSLKSHSIGKVVKKKNHKTP